VERLTALGIDCLKIEGRTKSHYYVARATQVYRAAIDDALAGRAFRPELLAELECLSNRGYTEGFYRRHAAAERQNYTDSASRNQRAIFVGEVTGCTDGWAEVTVRNRFAVGNELEFLTPAGNHRFQLRRMETVEGEPLAVAPGDGWRVRIQVPAGVEIRGEMGLVTRLLPNSPERV
jgi:putative protease